MAQYGEILDFNFDPIKETVYPLFIEYFNNPKMKKIKNIDTFSMYITKVYSLLGNEFRYIIAFVRKDNLDINKTVPLSELRWISLQTRTLEDNHNTEIHNYLPRRLSNLDKNIYLIKRDENQYLYNVKDIPITITLLPKTKNIEYSQNGTVVKAIETYQTIINFI